MRRGKWRAYLRSEEERERRRRKRHRPRAVKGSVRQAVEGERFQRVLDRTSSPGPGPVMSELMFGERRTLRGEGVR